MYESHANAWYDNAIAMPIRNMIKKPLFLFNMSPFLDIPAEMIYKLFGNVYIIPRFIFFMTLDIYLIRHAETEVNKDFKDRIGGRCNWAELTPKGIVQARVLGKRFFEEGLMFDEIYSSPAVRTQQTVRHCLEAMGTLGQPVELMDGLVELTHGDWEGQDRDAIYAREEVQRGLAEDNWNFVPGDEIKGESQGEGARRMKGCITVMVGERTKGKVMVSTHGLAIKYLMAELFGFDKKTAYTVPIDNTSITLVRYQSGSLDLITMNDVAHLKKEGLAMIGSRYDDRNR